MLSAGAAFCAFSVSICGIENQKLKIKKNDVSLKGRFKYWQHAFKSPQKRIESELRTTNNKQPTKSWFYADGADCGHGIVDHYAHI